MTKLSDILTSLFTNAAPCTVCKRTVPTYTDRETGRYYCLECLEEAVAEAQAEMMARACERKAEALEWKYGGPVQTWLREQLADAKGNSKSKRLPHGVVGYRTKPAGVCVTDAAAALSWAQENLPGAVTLALDKKALGEALCASGESVDFAAFQPAEEVFYIK